MDVVSIVLRNISIFILNLQRNLVKFHTSMQIIF